MDKGAILESLREGIASIESGDVQTVSNVTRKNPSRKKETGSNLRTSEKANSDQNDPHANDDKPLDAAHCFSQALASLTASDQPTSKIRKKLMAKGYSEAIVEETIEKLVSIGYLDDARYAEVFIRSKLQQGKGLPGILRDLRSQGIDTDSLDDVIEELTEDQLPEHERAYDFIVKHPPHSKNLREGAYRKLVMRGFSSDAAARAARKWSTEQENA